MSNSKSSNKSVIRTNTTDKFNQETKLSSKYESLKNNVSKDNDDKSFVKIKINKSSDKNSTRTSFNTFTTKLNQSHNIVRKIDQCVQTDDVKVK